MSPRKSLSVAACLLLGTVALSRAEPPAAQGKTPRLDYAGDPLPADALARLGTSRLRHSNPICSILLTPDGSTVIAGSRVYGTDTDSHGPPIRLWETASGKFLRGTKNLPTGQGCLALSPNGKALAAESAEGAIDAFEVATGKSFLRFERPEEGIIAALAFAPDGQTLAALVEVESFAIGDGRPTGLARQTRVRVWDFRTGKCLRHFDLLEKASSLAWSADGKALATGSSKGVSLRDAVSGKERWRLAGTISGSHALACSADGKTLAAGDQDGSVRLVALASGKVLRRLRGHRAQIHAVAFSPDGKQLASASEDNTLRLWDTASGKEVHRLRGHALGVTAVAFSANGKILASGSSDHTVKLWNPITGRELPLCHGHQGIVWSVAWSPDGKLLASGDRQRLLVWDAATGREVWYFSGPVHTSALAFAPNGKTLASVGWTGEVRLWEAATGKLLRTLRSREDRFFGVAWSPDGKLLATAGDDGEVPLWDVTAGKVVRRVRGGKERSDVSCVAFSPDGRLLVTGRDDKTTRLFEVSTGKEVLRLAAQTSRTVEVAFSPDGKTLATGNADYIIRLWDVRTGKERQRLEGHISTVTAVAFSADGRLLVSGGDDGTVRVWEMASGSEALCFGGPGQDVTSIALSPNGRRVVSGSRDFTAVVWDMTGLGGRDERLSDIQGEQLWRELAGNPGAAHRAVWRLAASPRQALRLLGDRLKPSERVSPERLARLVANLDDDRFRVRSRASEELERLGEVAIPPLRKALVGNPSLETRRRAEKLLETIQPAVPSPAYLRDVRGVCVLEKIGTPEARRLLRAVADGAPGVRLTLNAKGALDRLDRLRPK